MEHICTYNTQVIWNNTLEKFNIVWWPDRFLEDLADTGTQGLNKTVPKH